MVKTQMFIFAALISGVAIGYFVKPGESPAPTEPADVETAKPLMENKGESASVAALRARIAELEGRLTARGRSAGGLDEASAKAAGSLERAAGERGERRGPPTGAEIRERMARMEKEDPVRFAQMTNHFARIRNFRRERAALKIDFLSSIDTSGMNASSRKTHQALQNAIAMRDDLEEQIHNPNLSDEERMSLFEQMRNSDHELRRLGAEERDSLLMQTASAIGLEGDDAVELAETIKDIFDATESPHRGMRPRPME